MHDLTQVQSGRAILWNTLKVWLGNLPQLALIVAIPLFLPTLWQMYASAANQNWLLPTLVSLLSDPIAALPCAVAISEICLGNRPSVLRAYKRLLDGSLGKMLLTYLIYVAGLLLSSVLLIPVFFFLAWYMFALPVVVLEGYWGFAAFKRSAALGRGFRGRNLGLAMLVVALVYSLLPMVSWVVEQLLPFQSTPLLNSILKASILVMLEPLQWVVVFLLYLDMRARKEAGDNQPIVEDLLR